MAGFYIDQVESNGGERLPDSFSVAVDNVKRGAISELIYADGNLQAARREYLLFENSGKVAFLKSNDDGGPLREGDSVKNSELLAELDRRIDDASTKAARARLETARAALNHARAEYDRVRKLKVRRSIPASRFDEIKSDYQQALADVREAEASLDQATAGLRQLQIRAPFDGLVAFVNIREGQYVSPEQFDPASDASATRTAPIMIIDPKSFEIIVELPSVYGHKVKTG